MFRVDDPLHPVATHVDKDVRNMKTEVGRNILVRWLGVRFALVYLPP